MKRYNLHAGEDHTAFVESPEGEWVRWEELMEFTLVAANHAMRMDEYQRALDKIFGIIKELEGFDV